MSSFETVVFFLAVFGLTYLLRCTYGPGGIFLKFRILMGKHYDVIVDKYGRITDYVEQRSYPYQGFTANLVDCFWCLSTWVSALLLVLKMFVPFEVFYWLASICVAGTIFTIVETLNNSQK